MREKRQDIQGLRALAVMLVVVFHLWPQRLPGGYVGVDVFFVISGFLITSHLVNELRRTGSISLTRFWAKRIRRLLPAAFTVLGVSLVAALTILPKSLLHQTLSEIAASALYLQNWLLAGNSVDYLAAANKPSLAQHFWSLSVEEQFYAAWPILLLIVVAIYSRIARNKGKRSSAPTVVAALLGFLFLSSLAYSVFETNVSQSTAYFITPTRIWEFAAGGLIGFLPTLAFQGHLDRPHSILSVAFSWIGIASIFSAALLFNSSTAFPGFVALLPVLGTAMVIVAGDNDSEWSPTYLLRFGPAQGLGDISYSLYLWHWPVLILAPFVLGTGLTFKTRVLVLVLSVLLATLTKFFVEDPARNAKIAFQRRRTVFSFMGAGMVILVLITSIASIQLEKSRVAIEAQMKAAVQSGQGCFGATAMVASSNCTR